MQNTKDISHISISSIHSLFDSKEKVFTNKKKMNFSPIKKEDKHKEYLLMQNTNHKRILSLNANLSLTPYQKIKMRNEKMKQIINMRMNNFSSQNVSNVSKSRSKKKKIYNSAVHLPHKHLKLMPIPTISNYKSPKEKKKEIKSKIFPETKKRNKIEQNTNYIKGIFSRSLTLRNVINNTVNVIK